MNAFALRCTAASIDTSKMQCYITSKALSVATVSSVMNGMKSISDEVRERVFQAIQELNYKPNRTAQNLARSSSRCLRLFGSDTESMKTHTFLNSLISGIMTVTSTKKRFANLF